MNSQPKEDTKIISMYWRGGIHKLYEEQKPPLTIILNEDEFKQMILWW